MGKLDLTRRYKNYYTAKTKPPIAEIEPAQFLSVIGKSNPSENAYADKIRALDSTAYAIKFIFKSFSKDFTVSKPECLCWFDETKYKGYSIFEAPKKISRNELEYRLLIRMPDYVTEKEVQEGIETWINTTVLPFPQSL